MQKAVQQSQHRHWTSRAGAPQRSLTWNEVWHIAPLRISFLIREHVLSFCKVALSQRRYMWRHNRVLQEFAMAVCDAKGLPVQPKARVRVFTFESGTKFWCGSAASKDTQRGRAYWMGVMTENFQSISPNGTNILKLSKTQE
ncbi:reverse transcriptase [Plakobranchus ocellatus]|uniref:Reverse transcriptase n=1 Tax=Plakobranchus ocellatus TaxID=259542 RepID=A0AAV3ZR16_9GAST|nr:reverse transcriptase [Plakobranchus ocellatus]